MTTTTNAPNGVATVNGSAPALAKMPDTNAKPKAAATPKPPKEPKPKPEKVGKMEAVEIDTNYLLACLLCMSTDETRYYLAGVYLHRTADRMVRVVATDGHRALICNLYRENEKKPGPKWLDKGVIVPGDQLGARLKMIEKESKDTNYAGNAKIAYGENQPRLEVSDHFGVNVFRIQPIDGEFPDYERVTTASWSGLHVDRGDWKPTGFNPAYLKAVGDIAKRLDPESKVQCYDYANADGGEQPVLFTFDKVPNAVLFLMPTKVDPKMGEATRLLLAPAVRGSIAALKAHETRNRAAAKDLKGAEKDAAIAKADEFAKRIKAVLDNAGSGQKALPAPAPAEPPKPEVPPKIATAAKDLKPVLDKAAAAKPHNAVDGIVDAMARGAERAGLKPEFVTEVGGPTVDVPNAETIVRDKQAMATAKTTKRTVVGRGGKKPATKKARQ